MLLELAVVHNSSLQREELHSRMLRGFIGRPQNRRKRLCFGAVWTGGASLLTTPSRRKPTEANRGSLLLRQPRVILSKKMSTSKMRFQWAICWDVVAAVRDQDAPAPR
jgi:hypothetical protein